MIRYITKLKRFEKDLDRVIEDPEKIIKIIMKIIRIVADDDPEEGGIRGELATDDKVSYCDFVKYYGNMQVERAIDNGWDVEDMKRQMREDEARVKSRNGFNDESLPDGLEVKYK